MYYFFFFVQYNNTFEVKFEILGSLEIFLQIVHKNITNSQFLVFRNAICGESVRKTRPTIDRVW